MSNHTPHHSCPEGEIQHEIVVLKFGSSILADEARIADAVHEVYREVRAGRRVVVVCSAMGNTTDRLIRRAGELSDKPHPAAYAALVANGETHSSAQVALAIDAAGVPAILLDPAQIDLRTHGDPINAEPHSMNAEPIRRELSAGHVVVLPGFAGRDERGFTTLLGRGGSDLTALFVAHHVGASRCRLVKDVDGWYDADPKSIGARKYSSLNYADAVASPARIVQAKCVQYAADHALRIEVGALGSDEPTVVGPAASSLCPCAPLAPPIRVAMLGLGTVGGGVMRHMLAAGDRYRVGPVLVRDPARHADKLRDPAVLTADPERALGPDTQLVVEVMGGVGLAADLIERALERGISVVTANKALIARDGVRLHALADARGAMFLYSGAVGGGVPMLEVVRRLSAHHKIASLVGVLNGTTNFMLDHIARGSTYDAALGEAQRLGFAEADPTADVGGFDAAQKLCLLCRIAFDSTMDPEGIEVSGIDHLRQDPVEPEARHVLRLVARAQRSDGGLLKARISLESVPEGSALAGVHDEQNVLIVQLSDGQRETIRGRGAGRWPTAEAVFADAEQVVRTLQDRLRAPAAAR